MYIRTYSTNYSITLIIIIITIIIHTIQYIYYNYTQYQIWYLFTLYCVMWRGYVIHQLLYILHYAILYVYICHTHCDIWLWIIILYTTLIYYTITIIITIILIYFLFLLLCYCMCVRVCVVLCCLSLVYVCVCSLVYPRIYSYMCIYVCLPRITLPDRAVVKRLMCWYRGVYFAKKFLQHLENGYTTYKQNARAFLFRDDGNNSWQNRSNVL